MIRFRLPGTAWFQWVRNLPLRIGVVTGVYLTAVMVGGLLAANRLPLLESFADIRNWACRLLFALVMLVPICSFLRAPWNMFASGLTAWVLFSLAYAVAGRFFEGLYTRFFTAFHMFIIGASLYAVVAVAVWVVWLVKAMRTHLPAHERGRAYRKAE